MFFVPDYRMLAYTDATASKSRDPNKAQRYINYNPEHAPTIGLYTIKLNGNLQLLTSIVWTVSIILPITFPYRFIVDPVIYIRVNDI